MKARTHRTTIYFDPDLHETLHQKAAGTQRSISQIVNDAVRQALHEDAADLAAVAARQDESVMTHEALLKDLKARSAPR